MNHTAWLELLQQRQQALWLVVLLVASVLTWLVNARLILKRSLSVARVCLAVGFYLSLLWLWAVCD